MPRRAFIPAFFMMEASFFYEKSRFGSVCPPGLIEWLGNTHPLQGVGRKRRYFPWHSWMYRRIVSALTLPTVPTKHACVQSCSRPQSRLSFGKRSHSLREVYPLSKPTMIAGARRGGADTKQCTWSTPVFRANRRKPCWLQHSAMSVLQAASTSPTRTLRRYFGIHTKR